MSIFQSLRHIPANVYPEHITFHIDNHGSSVPGHQDFDVHLGLEAKFWERNIRQSVQPDIYQMPRLDVNATNNETMCTLGLGKGGLSRR